MTLENLGKAVHAARNGEHIIFVTKVPAYWLLGFIASVSDPINIMQSMRKAQWRQGSIIITDRVDRFRLKTMGRTVIDDEDCAMDDYVTYLQQQEDAKCSES